MNHTLKSITFVLAVFCLHSDVIAESNPHQFIDSQAQEMVSIIRNNQALYANDPELFKDKINTVFEPMVDFRRVGASVMGKNIILLPQNHKGFNLSNLSKNHCLIPTLQPWRNGAIKKLLLFFRRHLN